MDEIDLKNHSHPFKTEITILYCFAMSMKKAWNSRDPNASFKVREVGFNPESFHLRLKQSRRKL